MDVPDNRTCEANFADPPLNHEQPPATHFAGKRVAFIGKLGGMSRRDAMRLVREQGGIACEHPSPGVDVVVIGAEESPLATQDLLPQEICAAVAEGRIEVIQETQLWQQLGLVEHQAWVKRLYTPAMLADLLGVSVRVIRRWHRRGLIVPVRTVHKLPYFDFQEIATARRMAELLAAGASASAIEKKLDRLAQVVPDVSRPLAQLSVIVEGQQILLRQGEGLIEPGGQLRLDFDVSPSTDDAPHDESDLGGEGNVLSFADAAQTNLSAPTNPFAKPNSSAITNASAAGVTESIWSPSNSNAEADIARNAVGEQASNSLDDSPYNSLDDSLLQQAYDCEDQGDYEAAVDCFHCLLARDGARPETCFQLAELLYRMGQTWAARERYLMAIELDPEFVEARASLGGVLAEMGRSELAVAAFRGALYVHDEYPDVHYNLARCLDDMGQETQADHHWRRFLELAPESPWAAMARERVGTSCGQADAVGVAPK